MDDLISRQAAIDAMMALKAEDDEMYGCSIPESFDGERAVETLRKLPSAQPAIIRCKNCKNAEPWYGDKSLCFLWAENGIGVFNDGFCSYARKMEVEHETD